MSNPKAARKSTNPAEWVRPVLALLLAAAASAAAAQPVPQSPPDAGRNPIAPWRHTQPPASPADRVPLQNYRSDLDARRLELQRGADPRDLGRQEQLRDLRGESDRVDRLLMR